MSYLEPRWRIARLCLVAAVLVTLSQLPSTQTAHAWAGRTGAQTQKPVTEATKRLVQKSYAQLPLSFVRNAGQIDRRVGFYAQGQGYSFAFMRKGVLLSFARKNKHQALGLRFVGAGARAAPQGEAQLAGKISYFVGSDPAKWRSGLPTYGRLGYPNLWPGVDMAFKGKNGRLDYEFFLRPGAKVSDIRLAYSGQRGLSLDEHGNLAIRTRFGLLTDARPRSYQMVNGERVSVASRFVLGEGGRFGFDVGRYDTRYPLVIDPGLVYSTYLGGSSDDNGFGIATDAAGNAYVTGFTASSNFPTASAFDTSYNGGASDVFVTKLNAAGTGLLYSTFLGGSSGDQGLAIAVDGNGNAYVTGFTGSTNFPTKADTSQIPPGSFLYRSSYQGGSTDAFVTKLNSTGTGLVFSTFAGGSGADQGWGIAVHSSGDVYVTGDTTSTNWAATTNGLQKSNAGGMDAFFLRLDRFAAAAGYMTYLGGSGSDSARAIAIDPNRNVYLTGGTLSSNFPTGVASFDTSANGGEDAFGTKLTYGGSTMATGDTYAIGYSTYLGGSGTDRGLGITIDSLSNAYVTGLTSSTNFPTTAGALATAYGGGANDAFVTKLNPAGSAPLVYSTYLGGSGDDRGQGIALDSANDAHVVGRTSSPNFPTTPGAFDTSWNGGDDAFVTKLNPGGSSPLLYSTFLGGSSGPSSNNDRGMAIALDATANAYVTGLTNTTDFPTTPGAFDRTYNGGADAFVTKLDMIGAPNTLTLTPATDTNTVGNPHTVTATVRDFGGRPVAGVIVRFTVTGVNSPPGGQCTTNASGQCTFTYTGTHAGPDTINAYADTNNNNNRDAGEPIGTATKIWTAGAPTTLTLMPPTHTNTVGDQHCVTATVRDAFTNPVPGVIVRFSVPTHVATFAHPFQGSATTDANGQATFCFTASLPGADTIHAYADTNNSGTQDPGEPFADATKIWTPPASTAFCEVTITNGGWINAINGDNSSFGGNAKVSGDGSTVQGNEEYQDHGPADARNVKSTNLVATTCTTDTQPQAATIFGRATIDGAGDYVFRIDVTDGGNGGSNDSYGIMLSDGYASGQQQLQGGNVTIHK
jgi:Bacterial Ig-like domain (group 1)/Beta-propeller repeat